ncbi:MAG: RNA polymerase sigma factor [Candidatus Wildermuthbacteria bacterium]|nr:RNA polymerase sigma factor [Candidatus Wildermuthbacteria bacterium]
MPTFLRGTDEPMETSLQQFLKAYDDFADAIFRYCYIRVFEREMANDLVQETFVRTWKYMAEGKEIQNIRAFLYKTATNLIIDQKRKKTAVSFELLQEKGLLPRHTNGTEKLVESIDAKDALQKLSQLPSHYGEVVAMRYVEELSVREIAEILGETENTISVRIHRALQALRKIIPYE